MKHLKLTIPVYKQNKSSEYSSPGVDSFHYLPEIGLVPNEQIERIKRLLRYDDKDSSWEVVTCSPYVSKLLVQHCDSANINVAFSDGKSEISREEFFTHFATAMQVLA